MPDLIEFIKKWAETHYGLVIQNERIKDQVRPILTAHGLNEQSYIEALQTNQPDIVNATIDTLTIQESYFFRDASLFLYLKNTIIPQLIREKQQKGNYEFNIWSAGCAFGEEIYSIAIYLDKLLPNISQWKINLLATDINESALQRGREGLFTQFSHRATDNTIIREYFEPNTGFFSYRLKPGIREMVTFRYGNIVDSINMPNIKYDLIFCRNVFIYFNQSIIESALSGFYEHLVDNGSLFLGSSDLMSYCRHNFTIEIVGNIYRLRKKELNKAPSDKILPESSSQPIFPTYSQQLQEKANLLQIIRSSLDKGNYWEALEKIDNYLSIFSETAILYRYKGEALIGIGDTSTALIYLSKSIALDSLDAISHFLYGLVELDMKKKDAAIDSLQKALYIKNNFPEAAYHLSLLYLHDHQWAKGMKLLKQSLIYAQEQSKEKPVFCSTGTKEQFIKAINASIAYYQGQNHE